MRINIMDSILKSVDLNSTITAEKKIEVMVHGSREELPIILADPNRLLQVINNIMNNALKFAPESSKLNISAFSKGSGVEFSISDEGPGIALIDQQMIFQPFHSLSPSIDGKKSTGLGLAIVKRIVESHGGSVWVKSIKGHGSTFSVWIPTQQLLNDY
jgi:signal transduction histidine kinase